jgi:hypothetical protein
MFKKTLIIAALVIIAGGFAIRMSLIKGNREPSPDMVNLASDVNVACGSYAQPVSVDGSLTLQTFAGPPNYLDINKGDKPEKAYVLSLGRPLCLQKDTAGNNQFNVAVENVNDVQLVLGDTAPVCLADFDGTLVNVKGIFFGAETGHHHTPVLMQVQELKRDDGSDIDCSTINFDYASFLPGKVYIFEDGMQATTGMFNADGTMTAIHTLDYTPNDTRSNHFIAHWKMVGHNLVLDHSFYGPEIIPLKKITIQGKTIVEGMTDEEHNQRVIADSYETLSLVAQDALELKTWKPNKY